MQQPQGSKFKIGDTVQVVNTDYWNHQDLIGVVESIEYFPGNGCKSCYTIKYADGGGLSFWEFALKKVEDTPESNIKRQQLIADEVLSKVETIDPTCIIAGGAPRDWSLGNLANDLDVFMHFRPDLKDAQIIKSFENIGFDITPVGQMQENLHYSLNPNIDRVFETTYKGQKVQFVLLKKSSWDIVESFAFNICKVWYKDSKIFTTFDFQFAVKNKILLKTGELYACTEAYTQRIRGKFKDYLYFETKDSLLKHLMIRNLSE